MGRFHNLLPSGVAVEATVCQLNLALFRQIYLTTSILTQTDYRERLYLLAD